MKNLKRHVILTRDISKIACFLTLVAMATQGSANIRWAFSDNPHLSSSNTSCQHVSSTNDEINQFHDCENNKSLTINAWSNTVYQSDENEIELAFFRRWDAGLGVQNRRGDSGSPHHAVDNNGYIDALTFHFQRNIQGGGTTRENWNRMEVFGRGHFRTRLHRERLARAING